MKILILGAGKMGSFFTDLLSFEHEVAVLESDPKRMRFIYNALRLQKPEEVAEFKPELVINCVTKAIRSKHSRVSCLTCSHTVSSRISHRSRHT